jgi:hypothetical protein
VAAPLPDIRTTVHALRDGNHGRSSPGAKPASLGPTPPMIVGPCKVERALSST